MPVFLAPDFLMFLEEAFLEDFLAVELAADFFLPEAWDLAADCCCLAGDAWTSCWTSC